METNANINIYRESTNWKHEKTVSLVGSYDVWLENVSVTEFKTIQDTVVSNKLGDGLVILTEDLDLTNCFWAADSTAVTRHYFLDWDKFYSRDTTLHHIEAMYG